MSVDNAAPCRGVVVEPLAHVGIIPALGGSRVVGGDGVGASVVTLVGGLGVNLFRLLLEHGAGGWLGLNPAALDDREDRKRAEWGQSVSVRVDLGGSHGFKKKKKKE